MKAIQVNKNNRSKFLQACKKLNINFDECKGVLNDDFDYFFIITQCQNDVFKLGMYYGHLITPTEIKPPFATLFG